MDFMRRSTPLPFSEQEDNAISPLGFLDLTTKPQAVVKKEKPPVDFTCQRLLPAVAPVAKCNADSQLRTASMQLPQLLPYDPHADEELEFLDNNFADDVDQLAPCAYFQSERFDCQPDLCVQPSSSSCVPMVRTQSEPLSVSLGAIQGEEAHPPPQKLERRLDGPMLVRPRPKRIAEIPLPYADPKKSKSLLEDIEDLLGRNPRRSASELHVAMTPADGMLLDASKRVSFSEIVISGTVPGYSSSLGLGSFVYIYLRREPLTKPIEEPLMSLVLSREEVDKAPVNGMKGRRASYLFSDPTNVLVAEVDAYGDFRCKFGVTKVSGQSGFIFCVCANSGDFQEWQSEPRRVMSYRLNGKYPAPNKHRTDSTR